MGFNSGFKGLMSGLGTQSESYNVVLKYERTTNLSCPACVKISLSVVKHFNGSCDRSARSDQSRLQERR